MSTHDCTVRDLVDGEVGLPEDELSPMLTDPDTGTELHPQRGTSLGAVSRAVAAADTVHRSGAWADRPIEDRAAALRHLGEELQARIPALARADALDTGVPESILVDFLAGLVPLADMGAAQLEEGFGHEVLESSVGACDQWRLPWGPAAVLLPWNGPSQLAIAKTVYALVAGSPVVLKASEWAPHFSGVLAEAVQASLPPGLVQVVHGDHRVGAALVGDDRIAAVSYTGGLAGGRAVAELCARQLKPADLELAGNNAVVVLPGADPELVAAEVVTALLTLNGQYCAAPRRLIVPAHDTEAYVEAVGRALAGVRIGPTTDQQTVLGPMAHEPHRRLLESQVAAFADAGCEVRRFGTPPTQGHFTAPTIVLADQAPHLRDEVFGPVLLVRTYSEVDEAVAIANDHPYGLTGYVFGEDRDLMRRVARRIRAGGVRLNSAYGPPDVGGVIGMWGASGLGEIGLTEGPTFFTGARFVG